MKTKSNLEGEVKRLTKVLKAVTKKVDLQADKISNTSWESKQLELDLVHEKMNANLQNTKLPPPTKTKTKTRN